MKHLYFLILLILLICFSCAPKQHLKTETKSEDMIIRISEIQIHPQYLEEYISILKEEAEASVRLEPGVISIYPMYQKDDKTEIRILEIYADRKAYEAHLQTPHFKHYKTSTVTMVKSLKLIDMQAIDIKTMQQLFKKL
ncbi:antibiotic biosynthesis monooxygenase [Flavobacterium sp. GA093]|uniref:Antibiotic biosynthesis monooxygenase n=1 Tax=Flavobacterium hydrocarbonoxydans TaxID=2683249 RepID=A0A6I4NF45_9FLAO|nr:putative quinol monooxygenase [Flavobacterium hydrocarbonoxydans]MWB92828.1 antibiotic biosynthesis monooxygenase [Flavobacterium hydrocarbonoxydans]